jgi:hypothetical protein
MKNQSDPRPDGNADTGGPSSPKHGAGGSRRRFIKGGAAAAPVILTFTSRPVLGFEQACMTPSRMISGNHSGFNGPLTCNGISLSTYKGLVSGDAPWNQTFSGVFLKPYTGTVGVLDTFGAVFLDSEAGNDTTANTTDQFAAYLIAAYLNALGSVGSVGTVLTTAQVIHMWNDVVGTGSYCPQLTMCWDATQVIAYLQYSGIVTAT